MKTALVIGAASGIGLGIADAMEKVGFEVIRADIAFTEENKNTKYVDGTNVESIEKLRMFFQENAIVLDCLIITIGAIDEGNISDYQATNLYWMIDVNLLTNYRLVQQFIPYLKQSKTPRILLTGSAAGLGSFDDTYNLMPYIVSKHAVYGFFKAINHDLSKEGIQVSLFLPNRVKGKLSENSKNMREKFLHENCKTPKGVQTANDLADPYTIALDVVEKFLSGKTYISNNPQMILNNLLKELSKIKKDLLDE